MPVHLKQTLMLTELTLLTKNVKTIVFYENMVQYNLFVNKERSNKFMILVLKNKHLNNFVKSTITGGSLESPQRLVWSFCPKILDPWWGHINAICRSVNIERVVNIPAGSGETSTLHYVIKVVSTFCDLSWWGHIKLSLHPSHLLHLPFHLSCPCICPCTPFALTSLTPYGARAGRKEGTRV